MSWLCADAGLQGFDKHGGEAVRVVYYRRDKQKEPKNENNMAYNMVSRAAEGKSKMPLRLGDLSQHKHGTTPGSKSAIGTGSKLATGSHVLNLILPRLG